MSEEEAISELEGYMLNHSNFHEDFKEAIDTILDLYKQEKKVIREIEECCKKDIAFKKRLKKEQENITDYNLGRFDTSESILNIIKGE